MSGLCCGRKKCPKCSSINQGVARFCMMCGTKFEGGHPAARKAKIRDGSEIRQDMRMGRWSDDGTVFDAVRATSILWKLTAPGYGEIGGNYGNGSIFVRAADMVFEGTDGAQCAEQSKTEGQIK